MNRQKKAIAELSKNKNNCKIEDGAAQIASIAVSGRIDTEAGRDTQQKEMAMQSIRAGFQVAT